MPYCIACAQDTVISYDSSGGHSVCTGCGFVMEENAIVSEITFGETSGGAAMVQGSYVGADQTRARAPAGYKQKGAQESREQTILNGRRRIQNLAMALKLPERLADSAQRYYNLAVNMNFVQGRRTGYVVAACLYCACRMEKTSHMLIDFSDLLEINVFVLGSTYLKLVKELSLSLPNVDPSLYISRFAALLEFGDETQKVATDATRLVSRMKRDWMIIGRRPAGVCGACLLLAARMNNFRRSVTEVVQVVKIADVTLRKRLGEFKETASGQLTVDDFRTLWLDEVSDPPAFAKAQKREKVAREKEQAARAEKAKLGRRDELLGLKGDGEDLNDDESEIGDDSLAGNEAFADLVANGPAIEDRRENEEEDEDMVQEQEEEGDMAPPPLLSAKAKGKRKRKNQDAESDEEDDEIQAEKLAAKELAIGDRHLKKAFVDDAIADEVELSLSSEGAQALVLELDEAQRKRNVAAAAMTNLTLDSNDSLDDLDEAELDRFILTEAEIKIKSRLWMEFNKDYLQALADKQTGPDGELKPIVKSKPRKRNKPRDSNTATGATAAEATKQLLAKKYSKKINYSAIEKLFGNDAEKDEEQSDREESLFNDSPAAGRTRAVSVVAGGSGRIGSPIFIPQKTFGRTSSVAPATPRAMTPVGLVPRQAVEEEEELDWRTALGHKAHDEDEEIYQDDEA